jgi:hypothetical protein
LIVVENKKHLVAFLDILGFKKLIDEHFSGKDKQSLILLKKALKEAEQIAIVYSKQYLKQFNIRFSFRQFSDCVCISMPLKQDFTTLETYGIFINVVRLYQLILLDNRILVRGGIAVGGHFENSNIIFSEGLVRSYKLESQNAIYPRILIDKELLFLIQKNLIEQPENSNIFYKLYGTSLVKDWDDEVFISPFGMIGEIQHLVNDYGENELKNFLESYTISNKLEVEFGNNIMDDLNKMDTEKHILNSTLMYINQYLFDHQTERPELLLKYKWLRQFIIWTLKSEESQIKFIRYFQNAITS